MKTIFTLEKQKENLQKDMPIKEKEIILEMDTENTEKEFLKDAEK